MNQPESMAFSAAVLCALAAAVMLTAWVTGSALAQGQSATDNSGARSIPFEIDACFFTYPATMLLGEILGVAVNSRGNVVVPDPSGSAVGCSFAIRRGQAMIVLTAALLDVLPAMAVARLNCRAASGGRWRF